ncbi:MAG: PAS domain-containing protein, partial [Isosphaeraceae bacterium]
MALSNASKDPVDDDDGKSAKPLDDQRDRLGQNLMSLGDAVIVTDAHGNIILLNSAAESLTGWTDCDARNRPIE